jgi:hypothetical protein
MKAMIATYKSGGRLPGVAEGINFATKLKMSLT